jgi:hypothetical protein
MEVKKNIDAMQISGEFECNFLVNLFLLNAVFAIIFRQARTFNINMTLNDYHIVVLLKEY